MAETVLLDSDGYYMSIDPGIIYTSVCINDKLTKKLLKLKGEITAESRSQETEFRIDKDSIDFLFLLNMLQYLQLLDSTFGFDWLN